MVRSGDVVEEVCKVAVRQIAWRDFHRQVLAARPAAATADYLTKHDRWRSADAAHEDVQAWKEGRTGYPVIDAAMRQLRHEGWMHNRGRLLTASFLTKTRYVDWRVGARHFLDLLVDGDVADNQLNWQWMAGTGTDTRPNRVLNPVTQAKRYDPDGAYVRRWVPELAALDGPAVHEPWKLRRPDRAGLDDYPDPVVCPTHKGEIRAECLVAAYNARTRRGQACTVKGDDSWPTSRTAEATYRATPT